MVTIEKCIQALVERYQGALALGQSALPESEHVLIFQQSSLSQQHESLGAIITHLINGGYTEVEDFFSFLEHLPTIERWNHIAVHYVPPIQAFASQYGSSEGSGNLREARLLNKRIVDSKDSSPWALRNLQAATITWWLAEYSGWYHEQPLGSPVQGVDLEAEARVRSDAFLQALRDGAFQCALSVCSKFQLDDYYDQPRTSLTQYLLRDAPLLALEGIKTNEFFQELLMEQMESFVDAFITNMPDTLRQFQASEDDQRRRILGGVQPGARSTLFDQDLHLERFLVITSYAFDNRTEAAQAFWADSDSNLYGFLQWASKRQSTPRMAAFCELLRSISRDEECATAAHQFLLDEGNVTSARIRRSSSLSWAQIISELNLYASKIRESPTISRPAVRYGGKPSANEIDEPESALMLECYLRLMAHICGESAVARIWLLSHETFKAADVLFLLADVSVPPHLQACAFLTVRALLTEKTLDTSNIVWNILDHWASTPSASFLALSRPMKQATPAACLEEVTFETISKNFDSANEFIKLLQILISPGADEIGLHDALPFPEQLGAAYRMPGIDPYLDLVFGKIFASKLPALDEPLQLEILSYNVLNLAAICLGTFNENLVILANNSTVSVDVAIETSSLANYVRLHPFNRVMEWMFNDRVVTALFAAAHRDISEVDSASASSPIMLNILRAIEVMNFVMDLQSTYFEIVRPLVKLESTGHRQPVLNPTLASFEDSVATNLNLIVDLGLYCGTGNQELAISSIKLLEKLSASRRLNTFSIPSLRQQLSGNRLVGVLQQHDDLERVRASFVLAMQYDARELELESNSPGWTIKSVLLDFLSSSLRATPEKPNLAHALLGFACTGATLGIEPHGMFARQTSLFHAIVQVVIYYPDGSEGVIQSWSTSIRQKATQVLSLLRASSLTSTLTMAELRACDLLSSLFFRQIAITPQILWDGLSIRDTAFMRSSAAKVFEQYLDQRCFLLEYSSTELRLVAAEGIPSAKARLLSTFLGTTTTPEGDQAPNISAFDLVEFLDNELHEPGAMPPNNFFADVDFTIIQEFQANSATKDTQLTLVEQLLSLRLNELRKTRRLEDNSQQERALLEAESFLAFFRTENNTQYLERVRLRLFRAWANLINIMIAFCDLEEGGRTALILQILQMVMPKLERYAAETSPEAIVLGKLVQSLLFQMDIKPPAADQSQGADVRDDRLFQVFRTSLRAVNIKDGDVSLREVLYNICFRYLTRMPEARQAPLYGHSAIQTIKTSGKKVIDIVCDDAYNGSETCRASAVLFLDALAAAATKENSNYIIESLVRTNFILILVETIKDILVDLRDSSNEGMSLTKSTQKRMPLKSSLDMPLLLSYYDSKLALLLTLSQTRVGAAQIVNAGLFQMVRASGLFAADPDFGICKSSIFFFTDVD